MFYVETVSLYFTCRSKHYIQTNVRLIHRSNIDMREKIINILSKKPIKSLLKINGNKTLFFFLTLNTTLT